MEKSLFTDASQRLEKALKYVSISDDAIERLKFPKASLQVSIPVRMDVSMRNAAYIHALNRLGEAINTKGTRDYYVNG